MSLLIKYYSNGTAQQHVSLIKTNVRQNEDGPIWPSCKNPSNTFQTNYPSGLFPSTRIPTSCMLLTHVLDSQTCFGEMTKIVMLCRSFCVCVALMSERLLKRLPFPQIFAARALSKVGRNFFGSRVWSLRWLPRRLLELSFRNTTSESLAGPWPCTFVLSCVYVCVCSLHSAVFALGFRPRPTTHHPQRLWFQLSTFANSPPWKTMTKMRRKSACVMFQAKPFHLRCRACRWPEVSRNSNCKMIFIVYAFQWIFCFLNIWNINQCWPIFLYCIPCVMCNTICLLVCITTFLIWEGIIIKWNKNGLHMLCNMHDTQVERRSLSIKIH